MDADVEYKLSRYGRRVRQLVLIPDADVSDADTESDDDTTIGTSRHEVSSDDGSDWSTEDEEVPLAKLKPIHSDDDDLPLAQVQQQKSEDCQTKTEIANSSKKRPTFRWRNMSQPVFDTTWKDNLPDQPDELDSPIKYFSHFFTREMIQSFVDETNRYATQQGATFRTTVSGLERYIGILLRMGIVHMPRYRMYWSSELRCNAVADFMSRKDFEDHGRFLHFNDNNNLTTNRKDANYDPLFKVRPLLESLRKQCLLVAPEQRQSIDEQIIPFKGKSRLRQYLPKKPKRWGFKVIARCCARTGFTHDFTIYQGCAPDLPEEETVGYQPADFVILLCKSLPQHKNYILYFDNWFNFPELQLRLKSLGFHSVGTLRAGRLRGCTLKSDSDLRKEGRGAYDCKVDGNSGLCIIRWYDNRAVKVSSTHVAIEPLKSVKRWDNKEKKFVEVRCPAAVSEYNAHMGGVDLFDMLSAMYRIDHKSLKWYRRIFYWTLNVACINSWILYKRHCVQLAVAAKDRLDLLGFVAQVSQCLVVANKPAASLSRKRGRPPCSTSTSQEEDNENLEITRQKRSVTNAPLSEVRFDNIGHLPVHNPGKGRCRNCKKSIVRTMCTKCGVYLCLTSEKNCYLDYHSA